MNFKAPCQHGRYDPHPVFDGKALSWASANELAPTHSIEDCPGGVLLPPDSLVIVKEDGEWPKWTINIVGRAGRSMGFELRILDALAAAQPGSETELDRNQMGIW